nr:uncharacterized protein LOC117852331 isoform X1 [Setaria viridis]
MALRSLGSLLRGTIRARTCSSLPGIATQGTLGSAAGRSEADALHGLVYNSRISSLLSSPAAHNSLVAQRNLAYLVGARPSSPVAAAAAAAVSAFAASHGLHSRVNLTAQSVRARASYSSPGIVVQASTGSMMVKGARRFHTLRGLVAEHAHGAPAALTVAFLCICRNSVCDSYRWVRRIQDREGGH